MNPARWWLAYAGVVTAYWTVRALSPHSGWAALTYFAGLGLITALLWRRGGPVRASHARIRAKDVLAGAVAFGVLGQLWPLVEWGVGLVGMRMFWTGFGADFDGPVVGALVVASALLVAPLCEEAWFRGLGFAMLEERGWRTWAIVAATSLVFGLLHLYGGPGFAVFVTLWSVGIGVLRVWTGGLVAPITAHALNNAFAYLVVPLVLA